MIQLLLFRSATEFDMAGSPFSRRSTILGQADRRFEFHGVDGGRWSDAGRDGSAS